MARVTLEHVYKTYAGNVTAVRDVNLEIADKEFVVLVGPSGCGKSTTLRMVAGLEEISQGTITIGDRKVNDLPPKDRDIAMVFQNYALYPHMSVYDNMAFGLKLRRFPKAEIDRRVHEAAEILSITPYLDRRPKALSGGQRQRVAVGRAIVRKPAAFLFDEPLSNLDAKMRVQMRAEIIKLHHSLESTMIYVTHDQIEAMTMGDRIVVMKDGVVQQVATPGALYNQPANQFVAGFIGTPPMNFFAGRLLRQDGRLVFDGDTLRIPLPKEREAAAAPLADQPAVFGLRPENIGSLNAENTPDAPKVRALVDMVEMTGAETMVYLKTGAHGFIARVEPHRRCVIGQEVAMALDLAKCHLFNPATGAALF